MGIIFNTELSLIWIYYFFATLRLNYVITQVLATKLDKDTVLQRDLVDRFTIQNYFYNALLIILYSNYLLYFMWVIFSDVVDALSFISKHNISAYQNDKSSCQIIRLLTHYNDKKNGFFAPNSSMAMLV